MKRQILGIFFCFMVSACSTRVSYAPSTLEATNPKPSDFFITLFQKNETVPSEYRTIGSVSVGDKWGMTVKCSYIDVINDAKDKARKVGGDAIQVVQIKEPSLNSTCYYLIANVLTLESNN